MKKTLLCCCYLFLCTFTTFSQEVPVNLYTGAPGILIDLYTLQDHDLKEPIRLVYNLGDLRLGGAHTYGVGWDISSGTQQVAREVRGLPDDFTDTSPNPRRGWLYNNNYAAVLAFPNASDLSTSTCSDEQTDQTFIDNLGYKIDTEPDLFSFSVGSYSGHFVFGNDGSISLIPYQDIRIVPAYANAPADLTITGWTITTNDGVVYTLNEACNTTRRILKSASDDVGVNQTMLSLLERDYRSYNAPVSYASAWMLNKAQSTSGASFTYTYTTETETTSHKMNAMIFDAQWQINPNTVVKLTELDLMTEHLNVTTKNVSTIVASSGMWASCDPVNGIKIYDPARSSTESFREFLLGYTGGFLTSVTEADPSRCYRKPPYTLHYTNRGSYPIGATDDIPGKDFWGFYNGAYNQKVVANVIYPTSVPTIYVYPNEPGADRYRLYPIPSYAGSSVVLNGNANRVPDPNAIQAGTLSRLVYPTGGEMDFTFEANKYYDAKAGKDQFGGGLRIRTITHYDGVNPAPNVIKHFSYQDAGGHSSGRLVSRPSFALPVWQYTVPTKGTNQGYTKSFSELGSLTMQWRGLTMITGFDVSASDYTSGSSIGYARVTVTRPGSGKAVFDYAAPATYGDASTGASATDWNPTVMKFARPSGCPSMNIITKGEAGGYPLFPNTFYDYERGLMLAKAEYNHAGTLVRHTQQNYQYVYKTGTQPKVVAGLAYERLANSADNIYLHGRYIQLVDVAKVIASETVTTYDENNTTSRGVEVTQYSYASPYHRYVSKVSRTTPDGTVYGTSFKYTLDYPSSTATPSDSTLRMIQLLNSAGCNARVIEQQHTVRPFGGTEKTTGATLVKFRPFTYNKPLPRYTMAFRPSTPVADFVPSGVSNDVFTNDTRYETVETVNEYTDYDIPLSFTGEDRTTNAMLWGHHNRVPVAQIRDARAISAGFSDFETATDAAFNVSNGYMGKGRTGANGIHPYATLTRTIVKPAGVTRYLLAFWLKNSAGTTVTLRVVLKDTGGSALTTSDYTYTLTGNDYQYFIQPIDVSGLPPTFVLLVQGQSLAPPSGNSPSLLPMLDDVAFHPEHASVSSVTYDMPFGASAVTDASGITSYTTYDALGRVKWLSDQEHNIRQRYSYNLPGEVTPQLTAAITGHNGNYYLDSPINFIARDVDCFTGEQFAWDFGDGSGFTAPSASTTSPAHTYTALGTYTVTLRVSHPDHLNSVTTTLTVTIGYPPLVTEICAVGVRVFDHGVVTQSYPGCFTNPAGGDNWITAKVMSVANAYGNTINYQWQKRNAGATTWENTGTNSNTLGPVKVDISMVSFEWRCVITSSDGRTATTDMITVTVINN